MLLSRSASSPALNFNVHFHVVIPDSVFAETGDDTDRATFHKTARPDPGVTHDVMLTTAKRVLQQLEHQFEDVDGVAQASSPP